MLKNKLVTIIILCAAFLRLYRVHDFAMFLADQGRDARIVREIATFEHFPLIGPPSSIGQVYLGPFFYYLVSPFLPLFGFNPAGLAYGIAILSVAGLILSYFIMRSVERKTAAAIFLILCTFSSQLIWYARFSWNPNLLPVFSFLTLYFLYRALVTKKTAYSLLYGAFFSLSFQLHHLAAFLAVPIAAALLYRLFTDKNKKGVLMSPFVALASFLLIAAPLVVFDLRHDFLNARNLYSLFTRQNMVAGGSYLERVLMTNHAFWEIVLQTSLPSFLPAALSLGTMGILSYLAYRKKLGFFAGIHAVNFITFIFLFAKLSGPRHPHYYGTAYLSFYAVMSVLIAFVWDKKNWRILGAAVILLMTVLNARDYYFITGKSSRQIEHARVVAESIIPRINNKPYNFATYPVQFTSEEAYLYFLEKAGHKPADRAAGEVTEQMFVLCNEAPCNVLGSNSWNIDMFGKAKIDTMWEVEGIKVFRLIHE